MTSYPDFDRAVCNELNERDNRRRQQEQARRKMQEDFRVAEARRRLQSEYVARQEEDQKGAQEQKRELPTARDELRAERARIEEYFATRPAQAVQYLLENGVRPQCRFTLAPLYLWGGPRVSWWRINPRYDVRDGWIIQQNDFEFDILANYSIPCGREGPQHDTTYSAGLASGVEGIALCTSGEMYQFRGGYSRSHREPARQHRNFPYHLQEKLSLAHILEDFRFRELQDGAFSRPSDAVKKLVSDELSRLDSALVRLISDLCPDPRV
jgi:hypothetical protein